MLRLGNERDIDTILGLVLKFFRETEYSHLTPNLDNTRSLIAQFVSKLDEDSVCILWEKDGKVTGILAGQILPLPFFGCKVATESMWWVEPEARGTEAAVHLLDSFEYWAKLKGASMIQMAHLNNRTGNVVSRLYRRRGFKKSEITHVKEL